MEFIIITEESDISIIELKDDLNFGSINFFEKRIDDLIDSNKYNIAINMKNVDYVDSSGFGIIFDSFKKVKGKGFLKIFNANNNIKRLLKVVGMDSFIPIYNNFEEIKNEK